MRRSTRLAVWTAVTTLSCLLLNDSLAIASFDNDYEISLVSYWPFDGDLNDARDDNHGTLRGTDTAANYAPGKFGTGIDLDGIDQFVEITGGDESEFDFPDSDLTISAWFRVDDFTKAWQTLIAKGALGTAWNVAHGGENTMSYSGVWPPMPLPGVGPEVNDAQLHHLVAITGFGPPEVGAFTPTTDAIPDELWIDGSRVSITAPFGPFDTRVSRNDAPVQIGNSSDTGDRSWNGLIDDVAIWHYALTADQTAQIWNNGKGASIASLPPPLGLGRPPLQAGDADQDLDFDQLDLVKVQVAGKYLSGEPTTWGEGDWNGAPGGYPGGPPDGDGVFNQLDIVAAQQGATYLTGAYAAIRKGGIEGDDQTSIIYDARTGEIAVDAPAGTELTSINIDSAAGIFTGDPAENVTYTGFENDSDNNIFKATFGSSFGSQTFGNVAQAGLSEDFVANDLTVVGSLAGGGDLGEVDLNYIPEPSTLVLAAMGLVGLLAACGLAGTRTRHLLPGGRWFF